jgi:hypothetical protein
MAQLDRLTRRVRYGVQLAVGAWPQFVRPLLIGGGTVALREFVSAR